MTRTARRGASIVLDRLAGPPEPAQCVAEIECGVRVVGLAHKDGAQDRVGGSKIAALAANDPEIDGMRCGVGLEACGGLEESRRLVELAHFPQHCAEIAERTRIVRLAHQCGTIRRYRRGGIAAA